VDCQTIAEYSSQIAVAKWTSRLGTAYSLLPISGTFFAIGLGVRDGHFETGILGFEAIARRSFRDH
jgi:hypothetical protein